ncbi:hypothetical protein F5X97DRAFT_317098 [Nemania serpens]|nr:hypothetical protein F5X97DRAFT_317098 [Nemania serpens]
MDAYSATMNQPPQPLQPQPSQPTPPQSSRGVTLEDISANAHRRNNSHFESDHDFYAYLDSNRGPSMANAGPPSASGRSPPPAPMPPPQPQQQQQRNQPAQSRPPVTTMFPDRSRPPSSHMGSRSEELLVDKTAAAKMARQTQRRGVPGPTKPSPGPRQRTISPTPPVSGGSSPTHSHRPVSVGGDRELIAGSIQRLKSPSVMDCVLQPLHQKVREYDLHMRREQDELKALDEELHMLQKRRADAEARFNEAKAKHDEYQRQCTDVQRAMSGDLSISPRLLQQRPVTMQGPGGMAQQQQQQQQQQQPRAMSMRRYPDDADGADFDDDDEYAASPFGRRINSQQSFGRASQKTAGKERFRFSNLFGASR